jgi:CMP-N,N'-diacetyllegionaminic acid synthase
MESTGTDLLAIIPARGGSKGLPGKNIRLLAGLPLIAHSIRLAQMCPEITRAIVSTDSSEIASVARRFGAEVPFLRPAELAQDDTPMWPVLRHALQTLENHGDRYYEHVLLLDPTSPGRLPEDISKALSRLKATPDADGIIGVSQPEFNPIWHCVVIRGGWMVDLIPEGTQYTCRQEVPPVYRINASLYLWRAAFMRREAGSWRTQGRHLLYEIPESRAIHIDDASEFARADLMLRHGLIKLPWLGQGT